MAFRFYRIFWKIQQFLALYFSEGDTAADCVATAPGSFTQQKGSSRGMPGSIPICSRGTRTSLARGEQDAIQGSINSVIHRQGSTLTAESRLLCCSRAFVNSSLMPQVHQCILHTSLLSPICTEQSYCYPMSIPRLKEHSGSKNNYLFTSVTVSVFLFTTVQCALRQQERLKL